MTANPTTFYIANPDFGDLLCFGESASIVEHFPINWARVDAFMEQFKGHFIATMLGYDIKNSVENLVSKNADFCDAPDLLLVVPETVYRVEGKQFQLVYGREQAHLAKTFLNEDSKSQKFSLKPTLSRSAYIQAVENIKNEIQQGNCYELNFCQNFEIRISEALDSRAVFLKLLKETKAPFSAYVEWQNLRMMGASPERFLKKEGVKLISQPIKGTRPRGENAAQDSVLRHELQNDTKERAENIMIVDLVRNDLTRVAVPQTIQVDELCGIYSFHAVHQMISTISCKLKGETTFSQIVQALFPMGSMTGAPKISAMQLIDHYERFKRGWYSGSVGMIYPNGDFDLNVVIRSLIYNAEQQYLCCPVGSAITILSNPESEYEECMFKIGKILALFS